MTYPFDYPNQPHERKHGPSGYTRYQTYKDWLRDEFSFRCVYCFRREQWIDGANDFGVEHKIPKGTGDEGAELRESYENLVYACNRCNSTREARRKSEGRQGEATPPPVDPDSDGIGEHVEIAESGRLKPKTDEGRRLIDVFRLNICFLIKRRNRYMKLAAKLDDLEDPEVIEQVEDFFAFPSDLPNLEAKQPDENSRPDGVSQSYCAKADRGDLPDTY